jgi:hypothetical protein
MKRNLGTFQRRKPPPPFQIFLEMTNVSKPPSSIIKTKKTTFIIYKIHVPNLKKHIAMVFKLYMSCFALAIIMY